MIIIDIVYKADIKEIDKYLNQHREFLDYYYAHGVFLASGPKVPREGGVIIALTDDEQQLKEILAKDPYALADVVEYRFTKFQPVKHHTNIASLITKD